jgi:hypothetical protein
VVEVFADPIVGLDNRRNVGLLDGIIEHTDRLLYRQHRLCMWIVSLCGLSAGFGRLTLRKSIEEGPIVL